MCSHRGWQDDTPSNQLITTKSVGCYVHNPGNWGWGTGKVLIYRSALGCCVHALQGVAEGAGKAKGNNIPWANRTTVCGLLCAGCGASSSTETAPLCAAEALLAARVV